MINAWLASSLRRFFPASPAESSTSLGLDLAQGERASFQVVFRTGALPESVSLQAQSAHDGIAARIRRVGYVPFRHFNVETPPEDLDGIGYLPGLVPDPLFDGDEIQAGAHETNAFWVTVDSPTDAEPGRFPITLTVKSGDERRELTVNVVLHQAVLPKREGMPMAHILHADALFDQYGVAPWSENFWRVYQPYMDDYAVHGMDSMVVPLITPPLDGIKRPTQLLSVRKNADSTSGGEDYDFDWTQVLRWIKTAQARGISTFEWPHFFTQWGAKHAARVYVGHGEDEQLLWPDETPSDDPMFTKFLSKLLTDLRSLLDKEGILGDSYFHVSDEPEPEHRDNYRRAREIFKQAAPWARTIDALSDVAFAEEGLVDIPVPQVDASPTFTAKGVPHWVYFCCVPRGRHVNHFLDTPLVKVRMTGWLLHKNRAGGFHHWGYNYWYKGGTRQLINPYEINDATNWPRWGPGDPFVVYPGENGPVNSIRWEVFGESVQDLALLRAVDPDAKKPELSAIENYAEFPRDPNWIAARRAELLTALS